MVVHQCIIVCLIYEYRDHERVNCRGLFAISFFLRNPFWESCHPYHIWPAILRVAVLVWEGWLAHMQQYLLHQNQVLLSFQWGCKRYANGDVDLNSEILLLKKSAERTYSHPVRLPSRAAKGAMCAMRLRWWGYWPKQTWIMFKKVIDTDCWFQAIPSVNGIPKQVHLQNGLDVHHLVCISYLNWMGWQLSNIQ